MLSEKFLKEEKMTEATKMELKELPPHLKDVFLAGDSHKPIIINSSLFEEDKKIVYILRDNIGPIGWTLSDLMGISPSYRMHRILIEEDYKPVA